MLQACFDASILTAYVAAANCTGSSPTACPDHVADLPRPDHAVVHRDVSMTVCSAPGICPTLISSNFASEHLHFQYEPGQDEFFDGNYVSGT